MANTDDRLLEKVLEALTTANGNPDTLLATLRRDCPDTRILSLLNALLTADQALSGTFANTLGDSAEAELARAVIQKLTEAADARERGDPERNGPLRLSDVIG